MSFNWMKAVGYGLLIWVIMFAIVSALVGFKIYANFWTKIIVVLIAGALSYVFAQNVKPGAASKAIGYGAVWVIVAFILDWLITTRFDSSIFRMRSLWVGYLLILLAPWVQTWFGKSSGQTSATPQV